MAQLNPHRTRNHGSREHRESIKRMLDKTKRDNRAKVLRGKLQKIANKGIDWEGIARKHATPLTHKEHRTHSWLSPSGEFYDLDEFGNSEHQQWIKTLLDKHGDKKLTKQYSRNEEESLGEGFEDDMDDVRFMEDSNFIRLNSDGYKELDIGTANEPTNAQNKAIQDLAISKGFKSDNIIVDGYYPDTEEDYDGQKQLRRRMGLNKLGKLKVRAQKMALNLTEDVKYNMSNFMKRPESQKTRLEKELWGDMLATNSKDKMQLLTNLEKTRDDKILERDEDGDIVNSLGDTRGTALVHSFSEDKPHGIVSPIDKQEQEYQQTKLLMKQTADGKPPRMTQEKAADTLQNIEKGKAKKSRRPVDSTYKFKLSKLKDKLNKLG